MPKKDKILVVDDEQGFRDCLAYELGSQGYQVVTAANGEEALKKLKATQFKLVISDIKMPKLGGLETLEAIKRCDSDVAVIMATGYGTVELAVDSMKKGACDFIQKPFAVDQILPLVEKALQKTELREIIAVYEASKAVFSSIKLETLLPIIVKRVQQTMKADDVSIMLQDREKLHVAARRGVISQKRKNARLALGERVAGKVAQWKKPIVIEGPLEKDARFSGIPSLRDIQISIVQPLVVEGELVGILNVNRTSSNRRFSPADMRNLTIFSSQIAQAVFNAKTYRQLEDKVSELRSAYERLQEAQVQLIESDKLAAVGRLAAGVAHELNNPLTGILGLTQLLMEEEGLSEEQLDTLGSVQESGQRCRRIIQDLLHFSHRHRLQKESKSIGAILDEALNLASYELSFSKVDIVRVVPDSEIRVLVDPFQLQQVFLNLITNAMYAMQSQKTKRLEIRIGKLPRKITIQFKDTGCGIAKEHLDKLFEPFFTTKAVGHGTGLGLSISHGIISQHGGTLSACSEAEKGTTFTIVLPLEGAS